MIGAILPLCKLHSSRKFNYFYLFKMFMLASSCWLHYTIGLVSPVSLLNESGLEWSLVSPNMAAFIKRHKINVNKFY